MINNIFLIKEILTNGFFYNTLDIISIFAVLAGIFVITNKNPIISVLFLIGLFATISTYLIIIGLSFIGLSYLIVYIGAVSILFLFILMLINIRTSELQSNTSNSIALTGIVGGLIIYILFQLLPYEIAVLNNFNSNYNNIYSDNTLNIVKNNTNILSFNKLDIIKENILFYVSSKIWDGNLAESNHITSIGNIMYTNYNIWLILASFILLLAMVGSIVITIKPKY